MNSKRRLRALEESQSPVDGRGNKDSGDKSHIDYCVKNPSSVISDKKKKQDKEACRGPHKNEHND